MDKRRQILALIENELTNSKLRFKVLVLMPEIILQIFHLLSLFKWEYEKKIGQKNFTKSILI